MARTMLFPYTIGMSKDKISMRWLRETKVGAVFFLVIGIFFLLQNFNLLPEGWDVGKLWPLLLIIPAVLFIIRDNGKKQAS